MDHHSSHSHQEPSFQGSNFLIPTPTYIIEKEESSPHGIKCAYKFIYDQHEEIHPISHQFTRALGLLPTTSILPHKQSN